MAAVHPLPSPAEPRRLSGPKPALARLAASAAEGLPLEELSSRRSRSPPPSRRASWPPSRRGSAGSSAAGDAACARAGLDSVPALALLAASLAVAVFASDAAVLLRMPDAGPPRAGLDAAILVIIALWAGELAMRCAWSPAYRRSLCAVTDAAAVASLLADLSWLHPSGALMRACRAARLVRAARLTRVVGAAHAALLARRARHAQHAPRGADTPAPSAIAAAVSETVLHKLAVVLVVMLVCATPLLTQVESDGAAAAWRDAFVASAQAERPSLDALAAACAASFAHARTRPTALAVGAAAWSWPPQGAAPPVRAADRLVLTGNGVRFELDATARSRYIAKANVFMAMATIAALFAVAFALLFVTHNTVVVPLERIFAVIQASASAALGALRLDGIAGGSAAARAAADEGGPAMGAVEAAVAKLSRLVAHMSGGAGERGGSALESYLADDNVDSATRAWLYSQLGGGSTFSGVSSRSGAPSAYSGRRKGSQLPPAYRRASTPSPQELERMAAVAAETSPVGALSLPLSIGYALPSGEPQVSLALLDSWEFDALELSTGQLLASVVQMFDAVGAFGARLVSPPRLWAFAGALAGRYRSENPYHNFAHAVDVAHGVFRFLRLTERRLRLAPADKFALLVAALAHDLEHPGVNNAFLVATRHPLALRYNDASVLENRHCAALFGMCAQQPEADVFAGLDDAGWRAARRVVLGAVLATDMTHHFKLISQAELYLELHGDTPPDAPPDADAAAAAAAAATAPAAPSPGVASSAPASSAAQPASPPFATAEERSLLFALLLHAADIGNPARPQHIACKWAERVQAEFFAQGDAEAAASLPVSPGMARGTPRAGGQINFIEFVVAPLYALLARALPELTPCLRQLALNRAAFAPAFEAEAAEAAARGAKSEAEAAEECAKMRNRHRAFEAKYEALTGPLRDAPPQPPPSPGGGDAGGTVGGRSPLGGSTSPVRRRVANSASSAWIKAGSQVVRSLLTESPSRGHGAPPQRGSFTRDGASDPELGLQRATGRRGSFPPPRPPH